jgi:hypothetical protein
MAWEGVPDGTLWHEATLNSRFVFRRSCGISEQSRLHQNI